MKGLMTMESNDYPWIVKWNQMMGAMDYYIKEQVARAREDGAPHNATYEIYEHGSRRTHKWATIDDITSVPTRNALGLPPLEPEIMEPTDATVTIPSQLFDRMQSVGLVDDNGVVNAARLTEMVEDHIAGV